MNNRILSIDYLRVVACLLVILLHLCGKFMFAAEPLHEFFVSNILNSFSRICVPLFVMITGYLTISYRESPYNLYTLKITRNIIVPTLIWTAIYFIFNIIKSVIQADGNFSNIDFIKPITLILSGAPYYHMWYMYMIIPLYLIIPMLSKSLGSLSISHLKCIAIVFFILSLCDGIWKAANEESGFWMFSFVDYLGYYFWGAYCLKSIQLNKTNGYYSLVAYIVLSLLTALLTQYFHVFSDEFYFYKNYSPTVILASVLVFSYLIRIKPVANKHVTFISNNSFRIYLCHAAVIDTYFILIGISSKGLKFSYVSYALYLIIGFTVVFLVSLLICRILEIIRYYSREKYKLYIP